MQPPNQKQISCKGKDLARSTILRISVVLRLYTTTWTRRRLASNANIVITSSPSVFMQVAQYGALELRVCHVPVSGRISTRWCTLWAVDDDRPGTSQEYPGPKPEPRMSSRCCGLAGIPSSLLEDRAQREICVGKPFFRKISCRWTLDDFKSDFWKL